MPKIKTHKGAAKRFKRTASGKLKRGKAYRSHLKLKKGSKRVRHLRKSGLISEADAPRINAMLAGQ